MADAFPLNGLEAPTDPARPDVQATAQKVARLVALTTRLADRMDAMPAGDLVRDRDRRGRVAILRRTAEAGTRTLDAWAAGR